ncbi:MAG: NAD(P)-binding protein [Bacteroidota bacterium]
MNSIAGTKIHEALPPHLQERVRPLNDIAIPAGRPFVLYWMHHAVRAHENPAFDVAIHIANQLTVPILVYQGLAGRHPYNSDRHHTFILEGARDVARALAARGIAYAFYLGQDPEHPAPLQRLCNQAALVVTEDFPAPPFPRWYSAIARKIAAPFWTVDSHCILPMQSVQQFYPRAYQFREANEKAFAARVGKTWPQINPTAPMYTGNLGFAPTDLEIADIAALCASCQIDHAVGPVPHTQGGSTAGYHRWELFKSFGLSAYARSRNDPTISAPRGVSRLSPYLHHGHVSPFRIAREAAATKGTGSDKFLDELLIWRELAFNLCFHNANVENLSVLPHWAQKTLIQHNQDPRRTIYNWETLARAKTGDTLWDLAQQSLLIHGELHNNVRMTWGKAILQWTGNPATALRLMIDLNHRYALDGSDPNSYAGLLWCLGLFDRPFSPDIPIYGSIRPRPTANHANRLDLDKYKNMVQQPARNKPLNIAIIGAGMAGLTAGRILADHGLRVTLFDKARGPGGRMATRRHDAYAFDHGAQYFTARDPRFQRYVASWVEADIIAPWKGQIGVAEHGVCRAKTSTLHRYVGVPRMSTLTRHLATGLDIQLKTRVATASRTAQSWHLTDTEHQDLGHFDVVLVTTPPAQTAPLLADAPKLRDVTRQVAMKPCWALMASFAETLPLKFDGLFVHHPTVAWAARNNSKPGRPETESWVIHAAPQWSATQLELTKETAAPKVLAAFFEATGITPQSPIHLQAHRWRYALAEQPLADGCLWDADLQMGICGDWCNGSRVEGAFLSGMAAAGRILGLPDEASEASIGIQQSLF